MKNSSKNMTKKLSIEEKRSIVLRFVASSDICIDYSNFSNGLSTIDLKDNGMFVEAINCSLDWSRAKSGYLRV